MMNVSEYARDVGKEVKDILKLCKKLSISVNDEDDMLFRKIGILWVKSRQKYVLCPIPGSFRSNINVFGHIATFIHE